MAFFTSTRSDGIKITPSVDLEKKVARVSVETWEEGGEEVTVTIFDGGNNVVGQRKTTASPLLFQQRACNTAGQFPSIHHTWHSGMPSRGLLPQRPFCTRQLNAIPTQ